MNNLRTYGPPPFTVAVIHGGPGAGGEMAPVARELASNRGVLEPIQTATSLDGQVDELKTVLEENGEIPITLIGHSWGAWLSYIVAAKYPSLVKKLILVSSGGFEEKYGATTQETRLMRLSESERIEFESLLGVLNDVTRHPDADDVGRHPDAGNVARQSDAGNVARQSFAGIDKDTALAKLGALVEKADTYDLLIDDSIEYEPTGPRGDIFQNVWKDAAELRRSGALLSLAHDIKCPVVAIHGDYDPHPAAGVEKPLSAILTDFRFSLLKNCGHKPWAERDAKSRFYEVLEAELG